MCKTTDLKQAYEKKIKMLDLLIKRKETAAIQPMSMSARMKLSRVIIRMQSARTKAEKQIDKYENTLTRIEDMRTKVEEKWVATEMNRITAEVNLELAEVDHYALEREYDQFDSYDTPLPDDDDDKIDDADVLALAERFESMQCIPHAPTGLITRTEPEASEVYFTGFNNS